MRILLIISLCFNSIFIFCQIPDAKRDFQWLIGYRDSVDKTVINLFDFSTLPLSIQPFSISNGYLPLRSGVTICDTTGNLLIYSSGCDVFDGQLQALTNGTHITPNDWVYAGYCPDYYPFTQSWLILPDPVKDSLFYLLVIGHHQSTGDGIHAWGLYASHLSNQEVFEKNKLICADSIFGGHLTTCRHANGRDWWLVLNKIKTNQYYKYLLSPLGIHFVDLQTIGMPTDWYGSGTGQSAFSPDGSKFIHYDNVTDMFFFDFDRCSGILSNFRQVTIEHNEDSGNSQGGMAISPNSRFAYTFGYLYSYQVDLQANDLQASVTQVAYWDSTFVGSFKTTFGKAASAPDGKIYAAVPGGNPYMHIIHNPNAKGDSCQFEQHGLFLPYSWNTNTMPNFPNFRLGRMEGSVCDKVYTGTNEVAGGKSEIKILPNPNNGTFQIQLPTEHYTDWSLEIVDLNGQIRWQSKCVRNQVHINASLPPGLYILVCTECNSGKKMIQRFIVHTRQ